MPSILFDETALSMIACSRRTFNLCGDCLVKSSCFPRASPKSARYQLVVSGMVSMCCSNCRNVFIFRYACALSSEICQGVVEYLPFDLPRIFKMTDHTAGIENDSRENR